MYITICENSSGGIRAHASNSWIYASNKEKWGENSIVVTFNGVLERKPIDQYVAIIKTEEKISIVAIATDVEILKKILNNKHNSLIDEAVKSGKASSRAIAYRMYSCRVVKLTKNSFDNFDDEPQQEESKMDEKKKFSCQSQADGGYILYDEKGEFVASCDDYQEVIEVLKEENAEL